MLLAAHGDGSGGFVTSQGAGVLIGFLALLISLVGLAQAYLASHPRRPVIVVAMLSSARLLVGSVRLARLRVLYGERELHDPHLSTIGVTYRGRGHDIEINSFQGGKPLSVDLGSRIYDLLAEDFEPDQEPVPSVEVLGTGLSVMPSLVHDGQEMTFTVLTDGPCRLSRLSNPLPGVNVRLKAGFQVREDSGEARRQASGMLLRIIIWAVVIFAAFYLITQPGPAADTLNRLGNDLANFVNSL